MKCEETKVAFYSRRFKCILILPKGNEMSTKLCTLSKLSITNQEDKKCMNCKEDGVKPLCTLETFCK